MGDDNIARVKDELAHHLEELKAAQERVNELRNLVGVPTTSKSPAASRYTKKIKLKVQNYPGRGSNNIIISVESTSHPTLLLVPAGFECHRKSPPQIFLQLSIWRIYPSP